MNIKKTTEGWEYQGMIFISKKDAEQAKKNDQEGLGVGLTKSQFEKGKQRVNMWIDIDVLDEIKKRADNQGLGYQTLLNKSLRDTFLSEKTARVVDLKISEFKKVIRDALRSA